MIRDIVHEHPLSHSENNGQLRCRGCGLSLFGNYCCCFSCGLYQNVCSACDKIISAEDSFYIYELCRPQSHIFHQSCVDLPAEIQIITYRPHCLLHFEKESSGPGSDTLDCDFCKQTHRGFKFYCEYCDFQIGVGCASKLIKYHQGHGHVEHFRHHHPLTLLKPGDFIKCNMCFKSINDDPSYGCAPCEFYIHNSCRELKQEIRHPFHPRHSVKLEVEKTFPCWCAACGFEIQSLRYQCGTRRCTFGLHLECTSLKPNIKYKGHPLPLILVENLSYKSNCESCGSDIQGAPFMRCVECDFDFHVHCDPKPLPPTVVESNDYSKSREGQQRIEHFSHGHTLIISEVADLNCEICYKDINGRCYGCAAGCEFFIHNSCGTLPQEIRHSFHPRHSLKLVLPEEPGYSCIACCLSVHGFRYRCDKRAVNLHPGCIKLPRGNQHPFHRHLLFLLDNFSGEHHECNACGKHFKGFRYSCEDCEFNLDLDCSLLIPSIKPESLLLHKHTLTLFKRLYGSLDHCHGCKLIPPNRDTSLKQGALYVRCVKCNLNCHLLCCPLPKSIQRDDIHHHRVTLKDNFDDIFDDIEDDEYCCDVCETRRQAGECVYYCEECNFVVDLDCVSWEVMQYLEGKHKDVDTRVISRAIPRKRKGLSLKDTLESLTEEDKKCLTILKQKLMEGSPRDMFDELIATDQLVRETITRRLQEMDDEWLNGRITKMAEVIMEVHHFEDDDELVKVGAYIISRTHAQVLSNLLNKYGDFAVSCPLTQNLKTMFLRSFCSALQEMSNTSLMDIGNNTIFWWWFELKVVERAGFRVDFSLDHLKSTAAVALFSLYKKSVIQSSPFYSRQKEMRKYSEEMDELKAKTDKLNQGNAGHLIYLRF
ncbi:cysteine/Histidine-rich C1 domain family protein [Citrus sinensis]|nr:cysteine/Histidine-rich C1 domain family protein [Citrus sinensis]